MPGADVIKVRTYPWGTADLSEQVELLFLHYSAQSEVRNHDIRIFLLRTENQVLRLQILIFPRNG